VGGCEYKDPEDPGNLEFDWLEVQLKAFRERGIQVWLTIYLANATFNNSYRSGYQVRVVIITLRSRTDDHNLFRSRPSNTRQFLSRVCASIWHDRADRQY
jgi:hypothetical protein